MKQVSVLVGAMARKACGAEGVLHGFTDLTPADVEKIFRIKHHHSLSGYLYLLYHITYLSLIYDFVVIL